MPEKKKSFWRIPLIFMLVFGKLAKLSKAFVLAKPFIMVASLAVSAFAYAFWLGPWFGLGFLAMLFVHEMGHVIALRQKGFKLSLPVFVPFLGAAIFVPKFSDRSDEAYVGYGGPLLGSIGAALLLCVWLIMPKGSPAAHIVLITSYAAIFLNLFNMIPLSPLDGGRITQATGGWFQYMGVAFLGIITYFFHDPVILYVWVLVLTEIHFIRPKVKAVMAVMCTVSMAVLMWLGYGSQAWWVNLIDVAAACLFSTIIIGRAFSKDDLFGQDLRPGLPTKDRISWFALYAALTASLILLLMYQSSVLPPLPAAAA